MAKTSVAEVRPSVCRERTIARALGLTHGVALALLLVGFVGCDAGPSTAPAGAAAPAGATGTAPPLPVGGAGTAPSSPAATPVVGPSSEQDVRSAMLALVDAERQLRRAIQNVSNGATAKTALPDLEAGCGKVILAAGEYRKLIDAAPQNLPLAQIRVDFNQEVDKLRKEFPQSAVEKMDNVEIAQVWGNSSRFHEMIAAMKACQQSISAKISGGDPANRGDFAAGQPNPFPGLNQAANGSPSNTPTTPGLPPGFPVSRPPGGSPPNPDERSPLDSPPSKNAVVVMRGSDGKWTPVMVSELLPDGRVEVLVMKVVNGQLAPGDKKTVEAKELHRASPQLDLPGL